MARSAPRHDHDAGGNPEILAAKADVRELVWDRLIAGKASRFPGARGRIPNFVGAEAAAERLRSTGEWAAARTLKSNPDSPQWPVRQRALEDGKLVFMAVPRLASAEPFFYLDPDDLAGTPRASVQVWKERLAELYMAWLLSETLESRAWRSLARSAVVRPAVAAGGLWG